MQRFGDLDISSFVRMRRLNWIGRVDRMDRTRKISKIFNDHPQRCRLFRTIKKQLGGIVYKQLGKVTSWKERSNKRADWRKSVKEARVRTGL